MGGDDALRFGGALHAGIVAEGWVVAVLVAIVVSVVLALLVVAVLLAFTSVLSPRLSSRPEGGRWWRRASDAAAADGPKVPRTAKTKWRASPVGYRVNALLYILAGAALTVLLVELVIGGGEGSTRVRTASEAPSPTTVPPGAPTTTTTMAPSTSTTAASRTGTTLPRGPAVAAPAPYVPNPDDALALRRRPAPAPTPPPVVTRPPSPPTTIARLAPTTTMPARTTTSRPRTSTTVRPLVLPY